MIIIKWAWPTCVAIRPPKEVLWVARAREYLLFQFNSNEQATHVDESDTGPDRIWSDPIIPTKSDRNPGCGTTNGSDGKIIITPRLITIHLISTMGCNFTQLSDPIGSDYRFQ